MFWPLTGHHQVVHLMKRAVQYTIVYCTALNDEMEEIRARILAANKAYTSLQTILLFGINNQQDATW